MWRLDTHYVNVSFASSPKHHKMFPPVPPPLLTDSYKASHFVLYPPGIRQARAIIFHAGFFRDCVLICDNGIAAACRPSPMPNSGSRSTSARPIIESSSTGSAIWSSSISRGAGRARICWKRSGSSQRTTWLTRRIRSPRSCSARFALIIGFILEMVEIRLTKIPSRLWRSTTATSR